MKKDSAALMRSVAVVMREYVAVAITPLVDRLKALEAQPVMSLAEAELRETLGALRERMTVVETKAAMIREPEPVDLAPVLARINALETRPLPVDGKDGKPGADGLAGPAGDQGPQGDVGPEGPAGPARDGRDGLPGVPGAQGEKGLDGTNGMNGKNGADGLGFEDLDVTLEGDRTFMFRFARGLEEKVFKVSAPLPVYQGPFVAGKVYEHGDLVTYSGNMWSCGDSTKDTPGLSASWKMCVHRGREGRAGRDYAPPTPSLPVVTIGRPK